MSEQPKFILVEDNRQDRLEVLNVLASVGYTPDSKLGEATTYLDARSLLEQYADQLDLVLLDLNIPRDEQDQHPDEGNGSALLDLIHEDFNRRGRVEIKVIIVSGQDLAGGAGGVLLQRHYAGTLIGIARKADLATMLKRRLKDLRRDPLRSLLRRLEVDVLDQYDATMDSSLPIKERLKNARTLAIRLVMNDCDCHSNRLGSVIHLADDLLGLVKELGRRFRQDDPQRPRFKASTAQPAGSWGAFLWRGTTIQHLQTLNSYRNSYEHLDEQPFRTVAGSPDQWNIPHAVLQSVESGQTTGRLAELIVCELLEWYLPWHEQVYLPWRQQIAAGTRGAS